VADIPLLLVLGAMAGGFVNGLAGFGTALMTLGFWLQIMSPVDAVAIVLIVSLATGLQGLWLVRGSIPQQMPRLLRFLLPSLFGIALGVYCLQLINPTGLKLLVATLMIAYGTFFMVRRTLPTFTRPTHMIDRVIGLVAGVLGGLAGLSGALPAMWLAMRPWPKNETRAVLQPFSFVILLITAIILFAKGAYTSQLIVWLMVAIVTALITAQLGVRVYRSLTSERYRWLLVILLFVSGITLLATEMIRMQGW